MFNCPGLKFRIICKVNEPSIPQPIAVLPRVVGRSHMTCSWTARPELLDEAKAGVWMQKRSRALQGCQKGKEVQGAIYIHQHQLGAKHIRCQAELATLVRRCILRATASHFSFDQCRHSLPPSYLYNSPCLPFGNCFARVIPSLDSGTFTNTWSAHDSGKDIFQQRRAIATTLKSCPILDASDSSQSASPSKLPCGTTVFEKS